MRIIIAAVLAAGVLAGCQGQPGAIGSADNRPFAEILATNGLAAADSALTARQQTPETAFQLGGVRFLRAFEAMLQVRYESYAGDVPFLPFMRTPLPGNPSAKLDPAFLEKAMTRALAHLREADAALRPAVDGEFATELPLDAVWLDIDRDGKRAEWESLRALLGEMGAQADWESFDGKIRFDTADAEWLAAYVHLAAGMSELVLSLDPTPAIKTVYEGRLKLEQAGATAMTDPVMGMVDTDFIDQAAAVLLVMDGKPDAARTRQALAHFAGMIAHNRKFWPEMMAETDNDHEWLPNPQQTSPFGIAITPEVAQSWQAVLVDIEDLLEGRTLIPYWRAPPSADGITGVGVNLKKMLTDPGDMNIVLLLQGAAVAPYLEKGKLAQMAAWDQFTAMTRGDGLLMALILN